MTEDTIERLQAEASHGDYGSMARLARALYGNGLGSREVLRLCYGVEFPEEFFVISEAGPFTMDLPVSFTNQPWELAVTLDHGGPASKPDSMDKTERRIFALDPDLIPLVWLIDSKVKHGGQIVCYRLDELRSGRTTVLGIWRRVDPNDRAVRCGDSLLTVLHEHLAEIHRVLEWQLYQPSNRGAGSVDDEEVNEARSWVEQVEELQRRLASRIG
jgi:hypothetical protein